MEGLDGAASHRSVLVRVRTEEAVERMTRARSRTRVDNATKALGDSVGGEKMRAAAGAVESTRRRLDEVQTCGGFRASEHVPSSREWLGMLAASSSRRTSPPNAVRARRNAGGGVSELPTFITAFPCASGEKSRAGFFSGHCQLSRLRGQ